MLPPLPRHIIFLRICRMIDNISYKYRVLDEIVRGKYTFGAKLLKIK